MLLLSFIPSPSLVGVESVESSLFETFSPNRTELFLLLIWGILDFLVGVLGGLAALSANSGGGEGAGDACRDPVGLKPLPLKGLIRPVGEVLLEGPLLVGSARMEKDWFLFLLVVGVSLE